MSALLPTATTVGDLCTESLKECGRLGIGQTALAEDINGAWVRLQWMLQEWERKRWLVYHLVTKLVNSTGALNYTVGPGGNINTGVGSVRPERIESAFLRQLVSIPLQVDYPLELVQSMEDYNAIPLKNLSSFPGWAFYDPAWPLGLLYAYPIPLANIYAVGITIKEQLPSSFPTLATIINLPFEYYNAILYNLALRLRPKYGLGSYPGDVVPGLAKDSLATIRGANAAIAQLTLPREITRPGIYNIFSDTTY